MGDPFYAEGLRFSCRRCSACCRGAPGYIFLNPFDLKRLMARLSLSFSELFRTYCVLVDTGDGQALSLAEKRGGKRSYDCVFWDNGCTVYQDRPIQCVTYPFWASIVESRETWLRERLSCPGIDVGETHDMAYIEKMLSSRRSEKTIVFTYGCDPETIDVGTILGRKGIYSDSADARETEK